MRFLIGFIASVALGCSSALAAPPTPFNWSGIYIGGNVGYGWSNSRWDFGAIPNSDFSDTVNGYVGNIRVNDPIGGLQAGYNWQFNQYLVGIEATWSSAIRGTEPAGIPFYAGIGVTWTTEISNLWTVAARFGQMQGPFLTYFKVGVAGASVETSAFRAVGITLPANTQSHVGFIGGLGAEYMFAPNWTIGGEYNYIDLGTQRNAGTDTLGFFTIFDDKVIVHKAALRLNYRFGR